MGMGEPADNVGAVSRAVDVMTDDHGFALAKKYVCVSTVGPSTAAIEGLEGLRARLAWSVHGADDDLRRLLVPTTRAPMQELRDSWADVLRRRRDRGLMVELTLIDGVNDQPSHAASLLRLLDPLPGKTRVNLIPYNPNFGLGAAGALFRPSPPSAVSSFHRAVLDGGLICTVRTPRGDAESAACGQLATKSGPRRRRQLGNP